MLSAPHDRARPEGPHIPSVGKFKSSVPKTVRPFDVTAIDEPDIRTVTRHRATLETKEYAKAALARRMLNVDVKRPVRHDARGVTLMPVLTFHGLRLVYD